METGSLPSFVEGFLHCCCYSSAGGSLFDAMQHSFIQKHVETLLSYISMHKTLPHLILTFFFSDPHLVLLDFFSSHLFSPKVHWLFIIV